MSNGAAANPQSYSVSSADTWEKKSVTFSPHTSTAISAEYGLELDFLSQLGTTADNGTQDTWGVYPGYTSIANIAGTIGKYIEITGVQLSVGKSATDFEHLTYADELAACQRYYEQWYWASTNLPWLGVGADANTFFVNGQFKVEKRAAATIVFTGAFNSELGGSGTSSSETFSHITVDTFRCLAAGLTGLSAGIAIMVGSAGSDATLEVDAEL
jgi:hypothetical protein